jgi:hypothetical protein
MLTNWKDCPKPGKKRKKAEDKMLLKAWKRKSVFWGLMYWELLSTQHSLDMMHITKNVCENFLGTLFDMPEKSKDGPRARQYMKDIGIREELQTSSHKTKDTIKGKNKEKANESEMGTTVSKTKANYYPPACFTLDEDEFSQVFKCLNGIKVPFSYSGLIRRYLDSKKQRFSQMKSHDCHVMMTQLLTVALRGIMDDHVRNTLLDLCNFFDVMSRKSISVRHLTRLQEEIISILCELEIYFPPAFLMLSCIC